MDPERLAIIQKMVKILIAYMPYKFTTHRIRTDVMQLWLIGYRRHPTSRLFWRYGTLIWTNCPRRFSRGAPSAIACGGTYNLGRFLPFICNPCRPVGIRINESAAATAPSSI